MQTNRMQIRPGTGAAGCEAAAGEDGCSRKRGLPRMLGRPRRIPSFTTIACTNRGCASALLR